MYKNNNKKSKKTINKVHVQDRAAEIVHKILYEGFNDLDIIISIEFDKYEDYKDDLTLPEFYEMISNSGVISLSIDHNDPSGPYETFDSDQAYNDLLDYIESLFDDPTLEFDYNDFTEELEIIRKTD